MPTPDRFTPLLNLSWPLNHGLPYFNVPEKFCHRSQSDE